MELSVTSVDEVTPYPQGPPAPGAKEPTLPALLEAPEGARLLAILDASLLDWVPGRVGQEAVCLFDPGDDDDLEENAPWLVDLDADQGLARNLMTAGDVPWTPWGRPGAVFLHSAASLDMLRRHFRRIVMIPREDRDSHVFLRFWMADILTDLLSAASESWTAPVRLFGREEEPPLISSYLMARDGGVGLTRVDAPGMLPPGRLVLDETMERVLRRTMRARFAEELATHCDDRFPDSMQTVAPAARRDTFLAIMEQGRRFGLTQRGPLLVWAEASLTLGTHAIDDHAARPLIDRALVGASDQMHAAGRLQQELTRYAEQCFGPENGFLIRALERVEGFGTPTEPDLGQWLSDLWPERVEAMGPAAFSLFLGQVAADADALPDPDDPSRRAHGMLCFFLGLGVRRDPVHAWLAPAFDAPMNAGADSDLCRAALRWRAMTVQRLEEAA